MAICVKPAKRQSIAPNPKFPIDLKVIDIGVPYLKLCYMKAPIKRYFSEILIAINKISCSGSH